MKKIVTLSALLLMPFAVGAQEASKPVISTQAAPSLAALGGLGSVGTIVIGAVIVGGIAAVVSDDSTSGTSGT